MQQVVDVEAPMELSSTARGRLAPAWHTILVLIVIAASAIRGLLRNSQIRAGLNLDRITLYERTLLFEWLLLGLVLFGVWLKGESLFEVLGDRWRSGEQILRDAGLAVAFLIASIMITSMIGGHGGDANKSIQFLVPQSGAEKALWVLLSISAGICEEAVYRSYFQKQFMALTNSVPAGIGLAALTFAGSHLYQGWARRRHWSHGSVRRDPRALVPERAARDDRSRAPRRAGRLCAVLNQSFPASKFLRELQGKIDSCQLHSPS